MRRLLRREEGNCYLVAVLLVAEAPSVRLCVGVSVLRGTCGVCVRVKERVLVCVCACEWKQWFLGIQYRLNREGIPRKEKVRGV